MKRWIAKLFKDKRGAFAMQFALLIVPMVASTGLAVDGGRAFLARFELGSALDAAALAAGSNTSTDTTVLTAFAQKYVDKNFHSAPAGSVVLTLTQTTGGLTLHGAVNIDTYFMPLVGISTVAVSADSQVVRGGANIEVALILDTTGSMSSTITGDTQTKIAELRTAADTLVDTVVNTSQSPYYSKVAVIPYSMGVNVGTYADAARGPATAAKPISSVDWKNGSAKSVTGAAWKNGSAKTISAAGWKSGSAYTVSTATWKSGSALAISKVTAGTNATLKLASVTGLAVNDTVYITGTGVTALDNKKLTVKTIASPNITVSATASSTVTVSGSLQRCYNANCDILATTSSSNSVAAGDFVYISGASGLTAINNTIGTTWVASLPSPTVTNSFILTNSTGSATPTTSTYSGSSATAQECYDAACDVQITASSHGFANGDFVYISGISGFTYANNAVGSTWTVSGSATNTFLLASTSSHPSGTYSSGGTAQKCFDSVCDIQITSAGHGFSNNDIVAITGVGGFTTANNTSSAPSWTLSGVTASTFLLSSSSTNTSQTFSSNGSVAKCLNATCQLQVTTTAAHGLNNNDEIYITGVTGMTTVNNSSSSTYIVGSLNTTAFWITNVWGPTYGLTAGANGVVNCLSQGCPYYKFTNPSGGTKVFALSTCTSERIGSDALTDNGPSSSLVGRNYASTNNPCLTNQILPLSSDKTSIENLVNGLTAGGSTSGQVGISWGWYMISPNFASLWPNASQQPAAYNAPHTYKVAVLMTDGEFNSPYCNGVIAADATSGSGATTDHINCNATNGDAYSQSYSLCAAMKSAGVTLYTVGFDVSSDQSAQNLMTNCASDAGKAFIANSGADLQADFAVIAKSISMLRLSQ